MNANVKTNLISRLSETHVVAREILKGIDLEVKVFSEKSWRIRDVLGHIATWDRILAKALRAYADGSQYIVIHDWDKEELEFNKRDIRLIEKKLDDLVFEYEDLRNEMKRRNLAKFYTNLLAFAVIKIVD